MTQRFGGATKTLEQSVIELMQTPRGKEIVYDCYYDWDVVDACARFNESEEWEEIESLLRKFPVDGNEVLDLGAGNGIASYSLTKMGYSVTAIEPDSSNLVGYGALSKMAKSTKLSIGVISSLGEQLPFVGDSFSIVYTRQVLHHAKNLRLMLQEVSRVLKPGGILLATREHVIDDNKSLINFLDQHPLHPYTQSEWAYTMSEYIEKMKAANLRIQSVIYPWESVINHYPVSNYDLEKKMELKMEKILGQIGKYFTHSVILNRLYRKILSYRDRSPGRFFSFVAKVNKF